MELQVVNGDDLALSDKVFSKDFNEALVHQAVISYMSGGRSGTKGQKNRSDVRGGGIKPWRQKGTGRARAGTIRSPLWRSGGVTFAARNRDHSKKMNKKMYRGAMRSILSELVRSDRLVFVEDFSVDKAKTKTLIAKLDDVVGTHDVLLLVGEVDQNLELSARNLHKCEVSTVSAVNPVSLVAHEKVVATRAAIEKIQEWLA